MTKLYPGMNRPFLGFLVVLMSLCLEVAAAPMDAPVRDAAAGSDGQAQSQSAEEAAARSQLRELRETAKTPEEKVALTDQWLKAHPAASLAGQINDATFQERMARLGSLPVPPRPTDEKGALAWEARKVLSETLAQARTPEEAVALTDEFRLLNADALRELAPKTPTPEERQAQRVQAAAVRPPARPGNLRDEIAEVLRETRAEARTPEETVALTAEFLRLNADAYSKTQPPKSPQ